LSTYYPSISQIILYAPGSHVYSALDFTKNTSSWSKDGKPLPYIDVTKSDFWTFIKNQMIPMMTK
jgi:acyl-coA thioesterase